MSPSFASLLLANTRAPRTSAACSPLGFGSLTYFGPFLGGLIVQNQLEASHRATSGILCSLSHQRLTNIYLERFPDLTTGVPRAPKINQRMNHYPAQPSGENLGAEEKTLRRKGIVLAVVGALLIVLAVLDGWPVV